MSDKNSVKDKEQEANKPEKDQQEETLEEQVQQEEEAKADEQDEAQEQEAKAEENQQEASADESEEDIDKMKDELAKLKDQHLRLYADFENHKRRTAKERAELFSTANQELMSALLPVLDDFKRALKNMTEEEAEGVQIIYKKFENILKQKGLKPMESTIEKEFDVDTMEAVSRIPAPDKKLKGKVVDEIEQGFYLGDKILRHAKVVIGE